MQLVYKNSAGKICTVGGESTEHPLEFVLQDTPNKEPYQAGDLVRAVREDLKDAQGYLLWLVEKLGHPTYILQCTCNVTQIYLTNPGYCPECGEDTDIIVTECGFWRYSENGPKN